MATGPLGAPRPFASGNCHIVIYMRGVGRPQNAHEAMLNLEEQIRRNTPNVPTDGQTIYSNLPSRTSMRNTVEVSVGLDTGFKAQPETIERTYKDVERRLLGVASQVSTSYVTAGDPQAELTD